MKREYGNSYLRRGGYALRETWGFAVGIDDGREMLLPLAGDALR